VKAPPRHTSVEQSTNDIFQTRVQYFRSVLKEANISQNVKFIHIAGTKGKGSTCEYLASAINRAGYKVGVFTSPHLHTARERIRIGRQLISKDDLIRLGNQSIASMSKLSWPVFFDMFLSTALLYFGEKSVDYIILESGIGGRFDSTNFVSNPAACVITSISLDHQAILGDTIDKIAWQKAGIMKSNCPIFTSASQDPLVLDVFRKESSKVSAEIHEIPILQNDIITSTIGIENVINYSVQRENVCVAAAVLQYLNIPLDGMVDFYWPCRMETFSIDNVTVILDGSHNGQSVRLFLLGVKSKYPSSSICVLFGGGVEKCLDDMLIEVLKHSNAVIPVKSKHFKAAGKHISKTYLSFHFKFILFKYNNTF
jgi:dihydrofolate synthase/folylpolyglutamate synthase